MTNRSLLTRPNPPRVAARLRTRQRTVATVPARLEAMPDPGREVGITDVPTTPSVASTVGKCGACSGSKTLDQAGLIAHPTAITPHVPLLPHGLRAPTNGDPLAARMRIPHALPMSTVHLYSNGSLEPTLVAHSRGVLELAGLTAVANKGSGEVSSSAAANESPIDAECAPPHKVSVRVPGRNDIRDVLRRLGVGPIALAAVPAIAFNASNGVSLFGGISGAEANALAACKMELEDYVNSLRVQHRHPDCGECYTRSGVSRVKVRCEPRLKLVGDGGCFIAYSAGGVPANAVAVSPAGEVEFLIECACPFGGGNVH
jgi:hypothetical protein